MYSELARKNVISQDSQEMLGTITCESTLLLRALCISQSKTCVHRIDNRLKLKWTRASIIKTSPFSLERVWINTVNQYQDWFGFIGSCKDCLDTKTSISTVWISYS